MEKNIRPYRGLKLDKVSELLFMQKADLQEQIRYVTLWQLSAETEEFVLGKCKPEVVAVYIEKWSLHPENEVRLIKTKNSALIQKYVQKYPLSHDAQELLIKKGNREDVLCILRTAFPIYADVLKKLSKREKGLLEVYNSVLKFRAI